MQKAWKIAVLVLLAVVVAVTVSLKSKKGSETPPGGSGKQAAASPAPPVAKAEELEKSVEKQTGTTDAAADKGNAALPEKPSISGKTTSAKPSQSAAGMPTKPLAPPNSKPSEPAKPNPKPVVRPAKLIDLGSTTCIPCKQMFPVLDELKSEYAGKLEVEFIDIREDPQAAKDYGIRVIPTQIFFDADGNELFRHEGFFPKEDIIKAFKDHGVDLAK